MNDHRIKAFRATRGLTQSDAAELLGMSPTTYCNLEQGSTACVVDALLKRLLTAWDIEGERHEMIHRWS
jgi:DNA-binding XRE family transcriptional regulator